MKNILKVEKLVKANLCKTKKKSKIPAFQRIRTPCVSLTAISKRLEMEYPEPFGPQE